jgi:iron complex transport system substrate-binding protein
VVGTWRLGLARAATVAAVLAAVWTALVARTPARAQSQEARPARIVSTSPSITETLFALGLGDRVVGVSQYCRFPPAVQKLPKVGTFLQPDPERIAALRPDLVFVHSVAADLTGRLSTMHIRAVAVDEGTMVSVFRAIQQIADAAGVPTRGETLVADIQRHLDRVAHAAPAGPRPSVLVIVGRRPGTLADLVAVGPHAYLDAIIGIAGGRNVLESDELPEYPHISMETVLRLDPEVIVDTVDMGDSEAERRARQTVNERLWAAYPGLQAVKSKRLYADTTDALVVPGPRVVDAAEWLAALIRPQ